MADGRRGAIGLVAVGFSVYVVYVLEIVKVANPNHRRRGADDPLSKTRPSLQLSDDAS